MSQEVKWQREVGRNRERSMSQDSNMGCPKHNGAMCQHAAHEAIGTDKKLINNTNNWLKICGS